NHPDVYRIVGQHVEAANRKLASEPMMAASQIRRFLVLHKELDADDGELTRTQKVRRSFIAERYGELIEALYDGSTSKWAETEITYEDGRKSKVAATVRIVDAPTFAGAAEPMREAAE
ncbi:MAG: long-chain fatty acid--CoA ligase, partial [Mesorhizobium sp.]|nr:long-chain fatty acid--CoA ligase [Mesorhizobium sp.]